MRILTLIMIMMLASFLSFGCSEKFEFSPENLCEISGGTWGEDLCKCDEDKCPSGVICVLENDKRICADQAHQNESSIDE